MFKPVPNGSIYEVPDNAFGYIFKCQLPPVGYGVNSITGELQETDIIGEDSETPQKWQRFTLPRDWKEKRETEKERQKFNKYYADPYLEEIRSREWKRRLCGVWFWNFNPKTKRNELRYITGTHYFYITYWKFQGKFMDFRINDMEAWYAVKYCETDPDCLGINEITKRKLGKTAKLGCWIYERTSRPPSNQHAAFQSKADDDAQEVMKKAVVQPWQKLPDFFRPIYDTMKGDDPNELRFFHTSRRGSTADQDRGEDEEALESWIEYGASGVAVFDGPELDTYGSDEAGKTKKPVSILERQRTVRFCAEIDGEFKHRKQYYTTTVEIEPGEEDNYEFQEMTAGSNPLDRNENNRTKTGLYTYFLPAQKGMYFDEYGYPDEEKAIRYLLNERKKLEEDGDMRGLSSFKRKNPMTFKEAFSADGEVATFDPELINSQLDSISWGEDVTEYGDLEWVDGYEFERPVKKPNGEIEYVLNQLYWKPNERGMFEKVKGWWPKDPNSVYKNGSKYIPNNNFALRIGCDPFKYDKTKDKRRSNCAAFAYQLMDDSAPDDQFNDMFVLRYSQRRNSTKQANKDIIKMAWLCGCQVLFERNVNHWKRDFTEDHCDAFLMWMPGEVEPGIATDGSGKVTQMICNYTEAYINQFIKKVFFKKLMRKETGWLGFRVEDTQKFDEPMGAGFTLIAVKGKRYVKPTQKLQGIESILPYNKAI